MPLNVQRHLVPFLLYWSAGFLAWLLYTNNAKVWDLLLGAVAALFGAMGAEAARSAGVCRFEPRWSWLLQAWHLPWSVVQDCVVVFVALLEPQGPSVLRSVVFEPGGSDGRSAARRALAVAYATVSPNVVVLDVARPHRALILHHISAAPTPTLLRNLGARS